MHRGGNALASIALWGLGLVLASGPARADSNDLELARLGSPKELVLDGGQRISADLLAQERFARFASDFALSLLPMPAGMPSSLGDAGFELVLVADTAFIHRRQTFSNGQELDVWPTEQAGGSGALFLPTVQFRKGLPFGFELGTSVGSLSFSSMTSVSAGLKWALVEGIHLVPDVSVRAFAATAFGTRALTVFVGGWDVGVGERFSVSGGEELGFYGGLQRLGMNATTNNIDFAPDTENPSAPYEDDGVFKDMSFGSFLSPSTSFWRVYAGAQFRTGVLVTGLEASHGWGENAICTPSGFCTPEAFGQASGGSVPKVASSAWKVGARLGVSF